MIRDIQKFDNRTWRLFMMSFRIIPGLLFIIICLNNCSQKNKSQKEVEQHSAQLSMALPHLIIYKTKTDLRDHVPIILSEDKIKVLSFPHPKDLSLDGELSLPSVLDAGYLLDNRGIGKGVAFISLTYNEYAALKDVPSPDELLKMVIDDDPIKELYICGNRTDSLETSIRRANRIIKESDFADCRKEW